MITNIDYTTCQLQSVANKNFYLGVSGSPAEGVRIIAMDEFNWTIRSVARVGHIQ
jgi:hypothetical protein